MPHVLKNANLELKIDLPMEAYQQSRFDWSGKIVSIKYKGKLLTSREDLYKPSAHIGQGLFNEFGFKLPLGYEETNVGDWFHKIGIGLLKKEQNKHDFLYNFEIRPAKFQVTKKLNSMTIACFSEEHNGFAYRLFKKIILEENGLSIHYRLENVGSKAFQTNEYTHNFLSINNTRIGSDYKLSFPFDLAKPANFDELVDPEELLSIGVKEIGIRAKPSQPFFISDISSGEAVKAEWVLEHKLEGIGMSESTNFETKWIAIWGTGHVISPELYIDIFLHPNQSKEWTRKYSFFELG